MYGDCQAHAVVRVLHCIPAIVERFDLRYHCAEEQNKFLTEWTDEIRGAAFLMVQCIEALATYPLNFIPERYRPRTAVFPTMTFPSLWPFSAEFNGNRYARQDMHNHNQFELYYKDNLLELLRTIRDHGSRFSAYQNLGGYCNPKVASYLRRHNIIRIFELDSLRIEKTDSRLGSKVGKYILQNFRQQRLFHTVRHPTVELFYVLIQEILRKLDIDSTLGRPLSDSLDYYQIPVHPAVARTLGVKWVSNDTKYSVHGVNFTFEQYARRYISECG